MLEIVEACAVCAWLAVPVAVEVVEALTGRRGEVFLDVIRDF